MFLRLAFRYSGPPFVLKRNLCIHITVRHLVKETQITLHPLGEMSSEIWSLYGNYNINMILILNIVHLGGQSIFLLKTVTFREKHLFQ